MVPFKKHLLTTSLAAAILVIAAPTQGFAQDAVRIGTSSVGSAFYTIAIGASEIITKYGKLNATAEPVGGSSANVRGLGAKKIEFALANAFAAFTGFGGTHNFKKSGKVPVRLVIQAQPSNRWLVLRKSAKIKTASDLNGMTIVAKRRALPEVELVMDAFIKVYGLDKSSMKLVATTNTPQLMKTLRAGSVAAAVMPFSRASAQIQKPLIDGVVDFFYPTKEKLDEMLKILPPTMWAMTYPPGTFAKQTKPLHLLALNTYFLTRPGVSDDNVYTVIKSLLENNKEFMIYHKLARFWTLKNTLKNVALPFHPGAIRYFKEKGAWTAALEANQKKLLAR